MKLGVTIEGPYDFRSTRQRAVSRVWVQKNWGFTMFSAGFSRRAALRTAIKIVLLTAASGASTVWAADAPAENSTVEEVVVTGFRGSLEAALDDKRLAAAAIDTIRAEDIAKFPDSNLAESLQRIPGVSISRDAGEGRNLTVRGLGAQFTRVRINGMEALTTTGATDSSGGNNRD